jgi:hypothetical protein
VAVPCSCQLKTLLHHQILFSQCLIFNYPFLIRIKKFNNIFFGKSVNQCLHYKAKLRRFLIPPPNSPPPTRPNVAG